MKKLLSVGLALLLVLSLVPAIAMTAYAADVVIVTDEESFATALSSAANNVPIQLTQDISLTSTKSVKNAVTTTIDLNGFKLSYSGSEGSAVVIPAGAPYTTHIKLINSAEREAELSMTSTENFFGILTTQNAPSVTVVSGKIKGDIGCNRKLFIGAAKAAAYPTINGNIETPADLTIYNGDITGNVSSDASIIMRDTGANAATVCKITGNVTAAGTLVVNRSKLTEFTGDITALTGQLVGVKQSGGKISFSKLAIGNQSKDLLTEIGGDIEATTKLVLFSGTYGGKIDANELVIKQCTYTGDEIKCGEAEIQGGTYSIDIDKVANASLKSTVKEENGKFVMDPMPVAEYNGEKFFSIGEAITAAAENGGTVKLVNNMYVNTAGYIIPKTVDNLTIDLNGMTITDCSDIANTGVSVRFLSQTPGTENVTVTDSTATVDNRATVTLLSFAGDAPGNPTIRMPLNDTEITGLTLSNFDLNVTGNEDNHTSFVRASNNKTTEPSTLENYLNIENVNMRYVGPATSTSENTCVRGIYTEAKIDVTIKDSVIAASGNAILMASPAASFKVLDSELSANKSNVIAINAPGELSVERSVILTNLAGTTIKMTGSKKVTTDGVTSYVPVCGNKTYTFKDSIIERNGGGTLLEMTDADSNSQTDVNSTMNFTGCSFKTPETVANINGSGNVVNFNNCEFVNKKAKNGGKFLIMPAGSTANYVGCEFKNAEGASSNGFAFQLAAKGTADEISTVNLYDAEFDGIKQLATVTNEFNAINMYSVVLKKNNDTSAWVAQAEANIKIGEKSRLCADPEGNVPIESYLWSTGKLETELYVICSHTFKDTVFAPDCIHTGYTLHVCELCRTEVIDTVTAATGNHVYTQYTSNKDATCIADGTKTSVCDTEGCNETDTQPDVDSKLGHDFVNYVSDNNATCLDDGTETAKCERCEVTDTKTDVDSKLGHDFKTYVSNDDATCLVNGTETAKCERCEVTDTREDDESALGHDFKTYVSNNDATCTADGTETAKCERCEVTDTRTVANSAKGHTPGADATCTEPQKCTVCNEVLKEAKGHSYSKGICTVCNAYDPSVVFDTKIGVKLSGNKTAVITWSKVANATGYKVMRKTGNGAFVQIKQISGNGTVKYTDKTLKAGKKYTYSITPINANNVKGKSNSVSVTTLNTAKPKFTVSAKKKSIKLSWKAVTGAKKYEVQMKVGKKWKTVSTTSKKAFTAKKLVTGTKYSFRFRAVCNTVKSKWSAVKSTKAK